MMAMGYPAVSSTSAGRVSPTMANVSAPVVDSGMTAVALGGALVPASPSQSNSAAPPAETFAPHAARTGASEVSTRAESHEERSMAAASQEACHPASRR